MDTISFLPLTDALIMKVDLDSAVLHLEMTRPQAVALAGRLLDALVSASASRDTLAELKESLAA